MQNGLHPKKEANDEKILLLCENTRAGSELQLCAASFLPVTAHKVSTGALTPGWQHLEETAGDREQCQQTHSH